MMLTLGFVIVEAVAGFAADSISLLSDAGHNFADFLALGFSWFALRVALKPCTARNTFGFYRMNILAAVVNALSLVGIGAVILFESARRLFHPEPVQSGIMIVVALAAVILNAGIGLWLQAGRDDLNIRSAYYHMMGDAAAAAAVIVAGLVSRFTGSPLADPIVSIIIGMMIIWSCWGILKQAVNVLLEAAPQDLDMDALEQEIRSTPGVFDVHDLHVWTINSGYVACSCHLVIGNQTTARGEQILQEVAAALKARYQIDHTTIQVEVDACLPAGNSCIHNISAREVHAHQTPPASTSAAGVK
jgi:cobalt-zinc-cadmium efflux system protein